MRNYEKSLFTLNCKSKSQKVEHDLFKMEKSDVKMFKKI